MAASRANGGSEGEGVSTGLTFAARARAGSEDFSESFLALQEAVRSACASRAEWEAKIVAGIRAALEFAAEHPAKAHALTVAVRRCGDGDGSGEQELSGYFTGLLGDVAPAEKRASISTAEGIVESVLTVVRGHIQAGSADRLPETAPDLIYLALMPYAGIAGARHWSDPVAFEAQ